MWQHITIALSSKADVDTIEELTTTHNNDKASLEESIDANTAAIEELNESFVATTDEEIEALFNMTV
jgi:hypothetical protein